MRNILLTFERPLFYGGGAEPLGTGGWVSCCYQGSQGYLNCCLYGWTRGYSFCCM